MKDEELALVVVLGGILLSGGGKKAPPPSVPSTEKLKKNISTPTTTREPLAARVSQVRTQKPMPDLIVDDAAIQRIPAHPKGTVYRPVVSDGFKTSRENHVGIDVMYKRLMARSKALPGAALAWLKKADNLIDFFTRFAVKTWDAGKWPKEPQGTEWFFVPKGTPVRSIAEGRVWNASSTPRGLQVLMDHGTWTSYYQHLAVLKIPTCIDGRSTAPESRGKKVFIGKLPPGENAFECVVLPFAQVLGHVGSDPSQGSKSPDHLHFELAEYKLVNNKLVKRNVDPTKIWEAAESWSIDVS